MRSKEVDEALTLIELQRNGVLIGGDKTPSRYKPLVTSVITIDILLNYIMKLETKSNKCDYFEKENKFLRDENNIYKNETVSKQVIRDEIKDIEMQIKGEKTKKYTIPECFLILKTLKSIMGG